MNSDTSLKAEESSQIFMYLKNLLLWRDCRKTLMVFTGILLLLLDVMVHSVISVISMAGITVLLAAIGYRLLMQFWRIWKKDGNKDHISSFYPHVKIDIPREEILHLAGKAVFHLSSILNRMIELLLVEKWEDSLKFLVLLCGINLLGDCFNGLTLLIFGHVFIFTLPKLYESYKPLVDVQIRKLRNCKNDKSNIVEAKAEKTDCIQKEYPSESPYEGQESTEGKMLYKVCDNEQLLSLLEEEHRKGCRCRDCEHRDLPIEAH
ncbi:reticulon-1-A [Drosophila teissieri]|uniref:reticulon-1-A n=1 Tax=Drosophila teissieri TaxID=7243 RepID=UPI001CB9E60F|nr:reticulon-1-A [Drosophila teissieri]